MKREKKYKDNDKVHLLLRRRSLFYSDMLVQNASVNSGFGCSIVSEQKYRFAQHSQNEFLHGIILNKP